MGEETQIKISVCQGPYEVLGEQLRRIGTKVIIQRPGKESRYYENPRPDSFMALTDLIRRHRLPVHLWGTMVGYTAFWTPGTRAQEEVEGGDES